MDLKTPISYVYPNKFALMEALSEKKLKNMTIKIHPSKIISRSL